MNNMNSVNGSGEHQHQPDNPAPDELREAGRELRQKANDLRKDLVGQLNKAAAALRQEVRDKSSDPSLHQSVDEAATGLEKAAVYLNNHSVEDMGVEAVRTVKQNPVPMVAIVFVLGLIVGLLLRGGKR